MGQQRRQVHKIAVAGSSLALELDTARLRHVVGRTLLVDAHLDPRTRSLVEA